MGYSQQVGLGYYFMIICFILVLKKIILINSLIHGNLL